MCDIIVDANYILTIFYTDISLIESQLNFLEFTW